jgi:hypothetical protein
MMIIIINHQSAKNKRSGLAAAAVGVDDAQQRGTCIIGFEGLGS